MNEEAVLAGIVNLLKSKKVSLNAALTVIGRGDVITEVGTSMWADLTLTPIVGPLYYGDLILTIETPALDPGAAASLSSAVEFVTNCFPDSQGTNSTLNAAVGTATNNTVSVHFYHHLKQDQPPTNPGMHVRQRRIRLALQAHDLTV